MNPIIIIPDVHQNDSFLERVLELHAPESVERYIFLGDFFDAKEPFFSDISALEQTLKLVGALCDKWKEKVVLILGNHDVLYFYNRDESGVGPLEKNQLHQYYGIPDRAKLTLVRELELTCFWDRFQLAHFEQGFLFSHAGVNLDHWSRRRSVLENVEKLNLAMGNLIDARGELNPVFRAGFARGGDLERGGPLWLDWNREFSEEIGIPQIVGHTVGSEVRKMGHSYCLDVQQRRYGVLVDGNLDVKSL